MLLEEEHIVVVVAVSAAVAVVAVAAVAAVEAGGSIVVAVGSYLLEEEGMFVVGEEVGMFAVVEEVVGRIAGEDTDFSDQEVLIWSVNMEKLTFEANVWLYL